MYSEDDLVMISALQHYLFCPRQCALIHVEQLWVENRFTAEGRILHERVHTAARESRRTLRIEYDMPLRSLELGLIGRADVVEFHLLDNGSRQPYPVEYKRGRPKKDDTDRVQLCAQGICLEEMLDVHVPCGALYYGKKRRRLEVDFDQNLRTLVRETARALHDLLAAGRTPPPLSDSSRCDNCSFVDTCLPRTAGTGKTVAGYLQRMTGEQV
jgi:CRISPR-associated exonuclease Cas4